MKKCSHTNKNGKPCGNYEARNGLCLYHQPEERVQSLKHKEAILARQLEAVRAELASLVNNELSRRPTGGGATKED